MEDQNEKTVTSKKKDELESVPVETAVLSEQEVFERKVERIKDIAARVEMNLKKPVR